MIFSLMLFLVGFTYGQRMVKGTVVDTDGVPLIGANVLVQGTTVGTITDFDGSFSLNVPSDNNILLVSYTGYEDQVVDVTGQDMVTITLSEGQLLDEVVVTGLGIKREEKSLGYSTQNVDGDIVASAKETNIINSLQGRVAGVQFQGSPSTLGGSSRLTIRGSSSFLGENQPLFVVDGIPIDNSNFADNSQLRGFGDATAYDYGNTAQDIDPQSIKSVNILKGAAAAALYGQRGANGVILITTHDGAGSKGLGIEVNSNTSFESVTNLIPHQQQYGGGDINPNTSHGFNEVIVDGTTFLYPTYSKDGSWGPKYDAGTQVRHWDSWDPNSGNFGETRPWVAPANGYESFFETGRTLTNSIALSSGNENGSVRFGYTNLNQKGVTPNGQLDRNSFSLNSNYKLSDWLSVGVSGNYINTQAENRNVTGYNNANPMQAFTQWWQTQLDVDRLKNSTWVDGSQATWNAVGPQRTSDGQLISFDSSPNFFDNPYWVRENYLQEDSRNRFYGNANLTAQLGKGFSFTSRLGTDFYSFNLREGIPLGSVETSYYGETERRFQEINFENRINYSNRLTDQISLNALVGTNIMTQSINSLEATTNGGLSLGGFFNLSNSVAAPIITPSTTERGINSVFGQASVGFNDLVYLDLTARNDWSSTLPEDNNSYFYPSAAVSVILSELDLFSGISALDFLKLRGSYAEVGNDAAPYRLLNVYSPQTPNLNGSPRYAVPNSQNNSALKPERTSEIEFGIDARFFGGRLGVDVAYFDRSTKDQIFSVPTSAATGATSRITNAGEMRNHGLEFTISGTPIQTRDFSWDIGFNAFQQNNEVVSLADGVESIARGNTWAASLRISEGDPYMALYGQDFVYDDNGNKMVDENGFYMFTDERVFLGSAIADWVGGISNTFTYKGVTLGALIDFQQGGVVHSTSLQWAKYSGMHPETVELNGQQNIRENGMILEGVKADGTPNDIAVDPQTYYQSTWRAAAPNVYDASFVKLRELRLGFNVPTKNTSLSFLRGLNVSLYGRNLAVLDADLPYLDPQNITGAGNDQGLENAQVPSVRSFGINLSFKL